jgi:hypothetical protein
MVKDNFRKYRKGAASIYVVIFTTLLLVTTTGSFIRIVLRDGIGSGEFDSSQAALDAARIGVEQAKVALMKYHRCLTEGLTGTITTGGETINCDRIVAVMRDENASTDCNIVQKIMGESYVSGSEQPLGTKTNVTTDELIGAELDQAITCVLINEEEDSYVGALANSNPPQSKLVPMRTTSTLPATHIKVEWFADADGANTTVARGANKDENPNNTGNAKNTGMLNDIDYNQNSNKRPSPLYVQLLQANETFHIPELYLNEGNKTNTGAVLFVPNNSGKTTPVISAEQLAQSNNKSGNQPVPVGCVDNTRFACSAIIELPDPINGDAFSRNVGATFLRLMIPYGNPYTQYSITLCADAACQPGRIRFAVQSTISSTGRAGDSFRRVETRVEFVDSTFPLPQYALNIDSSIDKDFYVTINHWGGENTGVAEDMSSAE